MIVTGSDFQSFVPSTILCVQFEQVNIELKSVSTNRSLDFTEKEHCDVQVSDS